MNTPLPYETLITQKLEQLPLPDMADSIWASIDLQLGAAPANPPDTGWRAALRKLKGKRGWYGVILTVTVAVILFVGDRSKKRTPRKQRQLPPVVRPITDTATTIIVPQQKTVPFRVQPVKDSLQPPIPVNTGSSDSLPTLVLPPLHIDSSALKPKEIPPAKDSAVINGPVKKPRGVKGITPGDYKIITSKKDSLKKSN